MLDKTIKGVIKTFFILFKVFLIDALHAIVILFIV